MRLRVLYLLFAILFFTTCSKKTTPPATTEPPTVSNDVNTVEEGDEEGEKSEEEVVVEEEKVEEVYLLCEFRRTACYGKCPVFSIKLYSNGKAEYHGVAHIDKIGHYEAFCDPQDFESLFTAAEQANYFVLRSQYPTDGHQLADLPKTVSYLKRNGLEKRVINSFDAPPDLIQFEKWLDVFFAALTWEKIN